MNELWYWIQIAILWCVIMWGLLALIMWATSPDYGLTPLPT